MHALRYVRSTASRLLLRSLCPTGDARLDVTAKGVIAQNTFEIIVVCQRMRARSNQRHFTPRNIHDLGQLVDTCRSQQPSNGCESSRVACTTAGPFSWTVIVRNLNMTNSSPLNPFRLCRKITGPGPSSLIAMAVRTMRGKKNTKARAPAKMSMLRFAKRWAALRALAEFRWLRHADAPKTGNSSTNGLAYPVTTAQRRVEP